MRLFLNAIALGILIVLVWAVLSQAWRSHRHRQGNSMPKPAGSVKSSGYGVFLFVGGLSVGLLALVAYESYMSRAYAFGPRRGSSARSLAVTRRAGERYQRRGSPAKRLALMIAVGIGAKLRRGLARSVGAKQWTWRGPCSYRLRPAHATRASE